MPWAKVGSVTGTLVHSVPTLVHYPKITELYRLMKKMYSYLPKNIIFIFFKYKIDFNILIVGWIIKIIRLKFKYLGIKENLIFLWSISE